MSPDDQPQPDQPLTEVSAAAAISALSKPPAPPKGADGRFQSQKPREPEPVAEPDSETEIQPEAAADDDGALGDDEIEIEVGDEAEPTQAPSLEMPDSWGKTAVDLWQTLSPEHQQFLKQHEAKRTSGLSRQANELKAAQDQVKAEAARIEQERLQLAQAAQRYQNDAVKRFQAKFGDVKDVSHLAVTDKARWIEYQAALMDVQGAANEATAWQQAIDQERIGKIEQYRHDQNAILAERLGLDDEPKAQAFEKRITEFVTPLGITPGRLSQYSAEEFLMVQDAMKYRAAVAKRSAVERQKTPPPKVIRPGTSQTQSGQREQAVSQLSQTFRKTGRLDHAAALLKATEPRR